jgi:argininosuccinate synthase
MFSGGLDSTYLLLKLQQLGFTNVHAVAVNVGAPIDRAELTKYAAHFGAQFKCLDGRELFVKQGVTSAIRAHANYMGLYPISSSLSRPVIAKLVTDYAKALNAGLLLHTANLSQNSLPRLNNSIRRCDFSGEFGSPYVLSAVSREKKAEELASVGLTIMSERKLSGDENLWCREFEDGPVDDPEDFSIPEKAFEWTRRCDDETAKKVTLNFDNGNLVSVNGNNFPLIDAIALLNKEVGKFGHGRFVGLEPLSTDDKVLEVREAPAAAIIMDALRHLEIATLDSHTLELKQSLEQRWVREAVAGHWGSKTHTMCEAAIASALVGVGGSVTYNIDHRRFLPCSIVAQNPRYVRNRDEWEKNRSLLLYGNKAHEKPVQAIQGSTSKVFDQLAQSATLGSMVCCIATQICMFATNNILGIFSSPELQPKASNQYCSIIVALRLKRKAVCRV